MVNSFPEEVANYLSNMRLKTNKLGRSEDRIYEGIGPYYNVFIKSSKNIDKLKNEKDNFLFLKGLLPVPEVLFWYNDDNYAYLITKKIKGQVACNSRYLHNPQKLMEILVDGLSMISSIKSPALDNNQNLVFSHGDFCLPNIIIRQNKVVGFVDMGEAGLNCKEYDVATCIRSLEYNLKTKKYSKHFLELITKVIPGVNVDKVNELLPVVFG